MKKDNLRSLKYIVTAVSVIAFSIFPAFFGKAEPASAPAGQKTVKGAVGPDYFNKVKKDDLKKGSVKSIDGGGISAEKVYPARRTASVKSISGGGVSANKPNQAPNS